MSKTCSAKWNFTAIVFLVVSVMFSFLLISCDKKDDLTTVTDANQQITNKADSIYIGEDESGEFDYIAITNNGYSAALRPDSTYAWVCVLDSVVPSEKTGVVAYADASWKVQRVVTHDYILNFSYTEDEDLIDILVFNRIDKTTNWIKGIANPYRKSSRQKQSVTRAGDVLTPTTIAGALGDICLGAFGGLAGVGTSGLGVMNAFGGNFLTTAGIGAISVGIAFATGAGEIALFIGALKAVIDAGIAGINDMQNHIARQLYENARPVTLSHTSVGNKVYLKCRVNDASMNTNLLFNIGVIVADGLFITKNHYLQKQSVAYSGDHEYIFSFEVEKNKRYKYRAFLEPSFDLGFADVLDYWLYGDVENFIVVDKPVEITSFKQTDSQHKDYGFRYNYINYSYKFEYEVTANLNIQDEVEDWGYVYEDVQMELYRRSLKDQTSPCTSTGYYYSSVAKSKVKLYEYIRFKDDSEVYYGEPKEFELSHTDKSCPDSNHPHWIDLGLPSGTQWRCCNEGASTPEAYGGYYTFGQVSSAPTLEQIRELFNNCSYEWTTQNGVKGEKFTGPNGGTIFLPAAGYRWDGGELYHVGSYGAYWSSTPNVENYGYGLYFDSGGAGWGNYYGSYDRHWQSVRPVR